MSIKDTLMSRLTLSSREQLKSNGSFCEDFTLYNSIPLYSLSIANIHRTKTSRVLIGLIREQ